MKKSAPQIQAAIDLHIQRVKGLARQKYREVVWEVFKRIIRNTPQFNGQAVANWEIGLDSPSSFVDNTLGDGDDTKIHRLYGDTPPNKKGDARWASVALRRNRPKLEQIELSTKVYFSNLASGDTDGGKSGPLYVVSLQDSGYWLQKLRAINQPYETAKESILAVAAVQRNTGRGYRKPKITVEGTLNDVLSE